MDGNLAKNKLSILNVLLNNPVIELNRFKLCTTSTVSDYPSAFLIMNVINFHLHTFQSPFYCRNFNKIWYYMHFLKLFAIKY